MAKTDTYFDHQIFPQIYLQMELSRKLLVKIGFQKKRNFWVQQNYIERKKEQQKIFRNKNNSSCVLRMYAYPDRQIFAQISLQIGDHVVSM